MQLPWKQLGWNTAVATWIESELAAQGIRQTGEMELVRERPWSIVFQIPTEQGTFYFKALTPSLPHEPALVAALAERFPQAVPEVVALAQNNPWFIMRDAGQSLRSVQPQSLALEYWQKAMQQYAELQRGMASEMDTLLALGVLDRRLSVLPEIYSDFINNPSIMQVESDPEGLHAEDLVALQNGLPRVQELCRQLTEAGIPETIEHNDLHDNNIFVRGDSVRIADWGDSGIAPPFFSLTVVLRSLAYTQKLPEDSPVLADVRQTYLNAWADFAPLDELNKMADIANVLSCINRAQTWMQAIVWLEDTEQEEYLSSARGWLKEYLIQAQKLPDGM